MSGFTSEDFAQATLATRGDYGVARRADPTETDPWHIYGDGQGWFSDEEMAAGGWTPVAGSRVTEHTLRDSQEKAARKRERLVDHIADQDRVIRRRNDEIAVLRERVRVAESGRLSLDRLEAAWEAAERADECNVGDVLIIRDDEDNYLVRRMDDRSDLDSAARILSRAPRREPWADLGDKLAVEMPGIEDEPRIEALAKALYCEHGVRVRGGGE